VAITINLDVIKMLMTVTQPEPFALTTDREAFGEHVYTTLPAAITTLRQRQQRLRALHDETLTGVSVPAVLRGRGPVGVMFRQIGSANYETRRVVRLAAQHNLPLVIFEFHEDRFLTRNRDKYSLARPGFYAGVGRNGGRRIEYVPLFDLDAENGKPFNTIRICTGQLLADFHHRMLADECPELAADSLVDCSDWFRAQGEKSADYYTAFISLFLSHAILFETFVLHGAEQEFTERVFLPAFDSLTQSTGMKPLIVPAEREDWEGDEFWQLYPERLRHHLGPHRVHDRIAGSGGAQWETPDQREYSPVSPTVRLLNSGSVPHLPVPAVAPAMHLHS
jgi:hypothetical protein